MTITESGLKKPAKNHEEAPADFETAILAAGFGKFNMFLFSVAFISALSTVFDTSSLSYVFPVAHCDLNLSLEDKGLLNAMTYIGMISSSLLWGFVVDIYGRKKVLLIGFCIDFVFVLMSALSQNFTMLVIAKFFGGLIINGPAATIPTYLSEFHGMKHRSRVPLIWGLLCNLANICLPLLAWPILSNNFVFLGLYSWNYFLLTCALPAILSIICYVFLPESPKYLMTSGNNARAMQVFQKVYKWNTGMPKESYPIANLLDEKLLGLNLQEEKAVEENQTQCTKLKKGLRQIVPLFCPPFLPKLIIMCFLVMLPMMNTALKLWLPQMFQAFNDFEQFGEKQSNDMCEMLSLMQIKVNASSEEICTVNLSNSSVYTNSILVSVISSFGYVLSGFLINAIGKKKLLFCLGVSSGLCIYSVYFVPNIIANVILIALNTTFANIFIDVIITVMVDFFPTTLRASAISMGLMVGRIGSVLGNIVFPILLQQGCQFPFFTLGSIMIGCAFLALTLPNTDRKALE